MVHGSHYIIWCSAVYLGVYSSLAIFQIISLLLASLAIAIGTVKASQTLHDKMLNNILRSPMSFFDTTPVGRILNRFTKAWRTFLTIVISSTLGYRQHWRGGSSLSQWVFYFSNPSICNIYYYLHCITMVSSDLGSVVHILWCGPGNNIIWQFNMTCLY